MNAATTDESLPKELPLSERGDPARTHPAEHVFRILHHLVSAAREPKELLRFEYWSRHTDALRVGDIVFCEPADRSWFAVIRVLEIAGEGVVVQGLGGSETLRYQTPPPKRGSLGTNEDEFELHKSEEFLGKFVVVRKHDGLHMTKGQPLTKEQCTQWLAQYLKTARST
jgi:hypothetical protein